ncbi:hypothetical protein AX16_005610 [Volvariella volvacea WC 439]|nr:hypothetical protein AX16_005610 [Volvariella volvacea WC 439]
MTTPPPYYILLSHTPLSATKTGPSSSGLAHPIIQYQYQDDSPREFLGSPDEHVIVMDIDPSSGAPRVRSISDDIVVSGLDVEEAPGTVLEDNRSDNMYIVQTIGKVEQQ